MFKQLLANYRITFQLLSLPCKVLVKLVCKHLSRTLSYHLPSEDLFSSRTEFSAVLQTYIRSTHDFDANAQVSPSCFSWQKPTHWLFKIQIKYHLYEAFCYFPNS